MAEYFDLELLFGSLLLVAGAVVAGAFTAVCVAGWIGHGRPNPYDFDDDDTQVMEILGRDDAALAALDRSITPPPAVAALTPDDPSLPADLTSKFWQDNPSEPLKPSEIVRWRNITGRYEVIGGGS